MAQQWWDQHLWPIQATWFGWIKIIDQTTDSEHVGDTQVEGWWCVRSEVVKVDFIENFTQFFTNSGNMMVDDVYHFSIISFLGNGCFLPSLSLPEPGLRFLNFNGQSCFLSLELESGNFHQHFVCPWCISSEDFCHLVPGFGPIFALTLVLVPFCHMLLFLQVFPFLSFFLFLRQPVEALS